MPLTYSSPKTVTPAQKTSKVTCVGINIRLPLGENGDPDMDERSVTFYYIDAEGRTFNAFQKVPDLVAIDGAKAAQTYRTLKDFAYNDAVLAAAGVPTGGTVA